MIKIFVTITTILLISTSCFAQALPSWKDTQTKKEILSFINKVTDENSKSYVEPKDRIAVLDNDGTLWCEKPLYIHFLAIFNEMNTQIKNDPTLLKREPYKSIHKKDYSYLMSLYENNSLKSLAGQLMAVPFGGMSTEEYKEKAHIFYKNFTHPVLKKNIAHLIYQPMCELINLLHKNKFEVFIFTADEADFLREFSMQLYNIPPSHVFGSTVKKDFVETKDTTKFIRTYRIDYINNWANKPLLIQTVIGKKPIFSAGNSNGDLQMLSYVAKNKGLALLIQHNDKEREFAYTSHTDNVQKAAKEQSWTIVYIKDEWKQVFPN